MLDIGKRQKDSKNSDVNEWRNFKKWAQPKTLVVSLLKQVRGVQTFENLEFFQRHNGSFTKIKK